MICYPPTVRAALQSVLVCLVLCALARRSVAQDAYGSKGLFPVYESGGTWLIYDKTTPKGASRALAPGARFLVVGSNGADLFSVARTSATYGGLCRAGKPARLRASILKGMRKNVGDPILAIKVAEDFSLRGSKARYEDLPNGVNEEVYEALGSALSSAVVEEAKAGGAEPKASEIPLKIDYAARPKVAGLAAPLVLVTGAQVDNVFRRCLRLADGDKLLGGGCVEMPSDLMAETALLRFISYDPSGRGSPFLLAYTKQAPLWGHERWGFILRSSGARLFLRDSLDPRCREGF